MNAKDSILSNIYLAITHLEYAQIDALTFLPKKDYQALESYTTALIALRNGIETIPSPKTLAEVLSSEDDGDDTDWEWII